MKLEELNKRFVYKSDKEQYKVLEEWRIGNISENGKMYMDCEDYALTVKKKVTHDIYNFKHWDLYYCLLNNQGHCVLSNGSYVIDNNCKRVMRLEDWDLQYNIKNFRKFTKFEIFGKYVLTYLVNPLIRFFK